MKLAPTVLSTGILPEPFFLRVLASTGLLSRISRGYSVACVVGFEEFLFNLRLKVNAELFFAKQNAFSDAHLDREHFVADLLERQDVLVESSFVVHNLVLSYEPDGGDLVAEVNGGFIFLLVLRLAASEQVSSLIVCW